MLYFHIVCPITDSRLQIGGDLQWISNGAPQIDTCMGAVVFGHELWSGYRCPAGRVIGMDGQSCIRKEKCAPRKSFTLIDEICRVEYQISDLQIYAHSHFSKILCLCNSLRGNLKHVYHCCILQSGCLYRWLKQIFNTYRTCTRRLSWLCRMSSEPNAEPGRW